MGPFIIGLFVGVQVGIIIATLVAAGGGDRTDRKLAALLEDQRRIDRARACLWGGE